jgi:hypothetical protein
MPSQETIIHSQNSREIAEHDTEGSEMVSAAHHRRESSLADLMVRAASKCNRIIVEKCGLCTVYCDEQIQYEVTATGLANFYYNDNPQVQEARGNLFDETSVVDSICDRE